MPILYCNNGFNQLDQRKADDAVNQGRTYIRRVIVQDAIQILRPG